MVAAVLRGFEPIRLQVKENGEKNKMKNVSAKFLAKIQKWLDRDVA